jgi:hypothetical protein
LETQGHVVGESLPDHPFTITVPPNSSAGAVSSTVHAIVTPTIAHTPEEVQELRLFYEGGGNGLITTDHEPYPLHVKELLAEFGVQIINARISCANDDYGCLTTPTEDGRIPLVETMGVVKLYQGSAFTSTNPTAVCEIRYPVGAVDEISGTNAEGWCHTYSLTIGCGKLLVAGSNEPFSAMKGTLGAFQILGVSDPANPYGEEWLENQFEWLSTRLQPGEGTCPL